MTSPRRRWLHFSLRTMLIVVTLVASLAAFSRLDDSELLVAIPVTVVITGSVFAVVGYCAAARRINLPREPEASPATQAKSDG